MRIACLNVRSLLPKIDQIHHILKSKCLDVLGLNETWLSCDILDHELSLPGYDIVRCDRNRRGGGVCIFISDAVKYTVIDNVCETDVESIWIRLVQDKRKLDIGIMYRPPSADMVYYEKILNQIEQVNSDDNRMLLLGDLNFDYDVDTCNANDPIQKIEMLYGMSQMVKSPTRVTTTSSSLIDVILTNCPDDHVSTEVLDYSLSDHSMVFTEITNKSSHMAVHKNVTFRNFRHFNEADFINSLKMSPGLTNVTFPDHELNEKWHLFKKCFIDICNDHAPVCTRRLKERHNPWIDGSILELMYKRDSVKRRAVKLKDEDLFGDYKKLRNEVTSKIRQARKAYLERELSENTGKPDKIWKMIGKITKGNKIQEAPSDISVNDFNEFFAHVGDNVASQLDCANEDIPWKGPKSDVTFSFVEIKSSDVEKRLRSLGMTSNIDVLGFDAKLLTIAANVISPIVCALINASIRSHTVPSDWKFARVSPIYKGKGSRSEMGNYRPISVISHVAKVFEREVQNQLMAFLVDNDFISIDQSAYKKYHNTQTSLHRIVDDWLENMADNVFTGVCLLDIKKCFDSINHSILLKKLSFYGIQGNENLFFQSYLENRKQIVNCKNVLSDEQLVNIGVPQGSVLGPILFMLFVNDISQHIFLGTANLYADDCLIYCNGNDVDDVNNTLQKCIDDVSSWYNMNRLVLNVDKCNTLLVGTKYKMSQLHTNQSLNIVLNDCPVKQTNVADYLGVQIHENLLWDCQIMNVCKKLSRKVGMLSRLRKSTPRELLLKIYMSSIQPTIDYALTVWGSTTKSNLNCLQRIQNYAARVITGEFDYINVRGADIVEQLKWMNVFQRYHYFCLLLMFKCVHGQAPDYLCNNVIMECEMANRNTRMINSNDVYVPYIENEIASKTFIYTGAKLWKMLPSHIKDLTCIDGFKFHVKRFILQ